MHQTAKVGGTGHTVVQIVGDGNSVVTGHPHLTLTRYWGRRQIRQDLDRLSPYSRSTELRGREGELSSLHACLSDPQPVRARVLVGGGGSGKTRLALELCEQVSADGAWDAGFVTGTELRRFFDAQNLSAWGWRKPTLIVVDYAAQHAQLLGQWFDELADKPNVPAHPLRLLLLERSASTEAGWWTMVFASGGWGASSKRALLDPLEPVELAPLVTLDDRLGLVSDMVTQANQGKTPDWLLRDQSLREKLVQIGSGGDPLFLMMAALEMVRVGHAKALTLGRTDLAAALAGREVNRLQDLAKMRSLRPELVQHLTACVTLAQGMKRQEFEAFAADEKQAVGYPSGGDVAALADLLHEALPAIDGIAPVLPDLIGEALILRTLRQGKGSDAVLRCYEFAASRVTQSVIRCAQDFAPTELAALQWLRGMAQARWSDSDALTELLNSLSMESVVLADVRVLIAKRVNELMADQQDSRPEARAAALNALAIAQARVGQREAALAAAQESVGLYRELTPQQPDVFRPDLAGALSNLANRLSELGQREAALLAAQEAVELWRELAARLPDAFQPDLARSLSNLANRLSELGHRETALLVAQEAMELRRDLAAQRPDVFRPELATSLNNLAAMLSDLGQREAALAAVQESVELRRELAAQRPDVFQPDLATSLHNLANGLGELGQPEAALAAVQEAVALWRELAAQRPDFFRPSLATSLNNLASALSKLGEREAALAMAQEAVELRRELAALRPDVFRPNLATSLIVLALRTGEAKSASEALPLAHEAVQVLTPEFLRRPQAHAQLMGAMVRDYLGLCESTGSDPDLELLAPVLPYFTVKE